MNSNKNIYLDTNGRVDVRNKSNLVVRDSLQPAVYMVTQDMSGYHLDKLQDTYKHDGPVYGDLDKKAHRILKAFSNRDHNMGVLLEGEKGSGKTLLAKRIVELSGMPCILVNAPFTDYSFIEFIYRIDCECIVIFDEFEKVYKFSDDQESILTLLDGVLPSRKLIIFTINDELSSDKLINRPGRIYYRLYYKHLSEQFVREYCQDNLDDKSHVNGIVNLHKLSPMNFDMVQALVEEMNFFKEPARASLEWLNIKPSKNQHLFNVEVRNNKTGRLVYSKEEPVDLFASLWRFRVDPQVNEETGEIEDSVVEESYVSQFVFDKHFVSYEDGVLTLKNENDTATFSMAEKKHSISFADYYI